jgi:hypothetical protein
MKHLYRAIASGIACLSLIAIFIWSCLEYGQFDHSGPERCRGRKSFPENDPRKPADPEHGFYGDKDLYGMGTRVGIYSQWLASLIATTFLDFEQTRLTAAFIGFEIATLAAFFFLIFNHDCVFTMECLVILYFLFGGIAAVLGPDLVAGLIGRRIAKKLGVQDFIVILLVCIVSAVALWFWIRFASVGDDVDFAQTPGGTSLFIFIHARHTQITGAGIFLACFCILLVIWTFEKAVGLAITKMLELRVEPPSLWIAFCCIVVAAVLRRLGLPAQSPFWPKRVVDWAILCLPWKDSWSQSAWRKCLQDKAEDLCPEWKTGPNRLCEMGTPKSIEDKMLNDQVGYGIAVKL